MIESMSAAVAGLPLHEQVDHVIQASGLIAHYRKQPGEKAEGRIENLDELVSAARDYEPGPDEEEMPPLDAFLSHAVLESGDTQTEAWQDGVQLMTLHSAKGLEFPLVFLAGMEDGLFPHRRSIADPEGMEEERRLCYVVDDDSGIQLGQRVRHGKFGEGVVLSCEGSGAHARVQVNFEGAGTKWLVMSYANLELM